MIANKTAIHYSPNEALKGNHMAFNNVDNNHTVYSTITGLDTNGTICNNTNYEITYNRYESTTPLSFRLLTWTDT